MKRLLKMVIEEYKYGSEDERNEHVKQMESQGWSCSGQLQRSDDSLMKQNRKYYWFAKFSKMM